MKSGIRELFSKVPETYELVNHVLTFGLDIRWRRKAAKELIREDIIKILDVCSGTGEMAQALQKEVRENVKVFALDFCLEMLKKVKDKQDTKNLHLCIADAGRLPFCDETFDLVTISFATRNINTSNAILQKYFQEFKRVLKPGGKFVNLETSQPPFVIIRKLFHLYVRLIVRPIGGLISGSKAAYEYLSYTIPRFFYAGELTHILYNSGFSKVSFNYMTFGTCARHVAIKS